jgi:hypothetical protein
MSFSAQPIVSTTAARLSVLVPQSHKAQAAGWQKAAAISPAVENRAHLFLARQFPATGRALGSPDYGLSRVFPSGLSDYYAEAIMKPVLVFIVDFLIGIAFY